MAFGDMLAPRVWRYRGVEFGTDERPVNALSGWVGDWTAKTGDLRQSRGPGSYVGPHFLAAREVGMTITGRPQDVFHLERSLIIQEQTLYPLERQDLDDQGHRFVNARVVSLRRHRLRTTAIHRWDVLFLANDPWVRSVAESATMITPGTDSTVVNAGTGLAYPKITITGPTSGTLSKVTVKNATTGRQMVLEHDVEAGETLVADVNAYVTGIGRVIDFEGASAFGAWQRIREPLVLVSDGNVMQVTTEGSATGATFTISWRSAWA